MKWANRGKAQHGKHLIRTEVETFDEALQLLQWRQASKKRAGMMKARPLSLRQQFALNRGHEQTVTLSDRKVRTGNKLTHEKWRKPDVVWSKAQIIAAWKTHNFKVMDLAWRGKVSAHQIKHWCWPDYVPQMWNCCCGNCGNYGQRCKRCGLDWKVNFDIED